MYKVLWLLKRKPGITFEQFRDHYEASHSVLARKYFGHLMLSYKRNYVVATQGGSVTIEGSSSLETKSWDHDCITEWVTADEETFNEIMRFFVDPVIGQVFYEDEEHFLDREATRLICCDMRDTGTQFS